VSFPGKASAAGVGASLSSDAVASAPMGIFHPAPPDFSPDSLAERTHWHLWLHQSKTMFALNLLLLLLCRCCCCAAAAAAPLWLSCCPWLLLLLLWSLCVIGRFVAGFVFLRLPLLRFLGEIGHENGIRRLDGMLDSVCGVSGKNGGRWRWRRGGNSGI